MILKWWYLQVALTVFFSANISPQVSITAADVTLISLCSTFPVSTKADLNSCRRPVAILNSNDALSAFSKRVCKAMLGESMQVNRHELTSTRHIFAAGEKATEDDKMLWKPFSRRFVHYNLLMFGIEEFVSDPHGLWLEFGVYEGYSLNLTSLVRDKRFSSNDIMQPVTASSKTSSAPPISDIYGFDSFRGLPEDWRSASTGRLFMAAGTFSLQGILPPVEHDVQLIPGWFNETIGTFFAEHSDEKVTFVNIDNDLYSGARFILEHVLPRVRRGTVLHFHEFFLFKAAECKGQEELTALYDVLIEGVRTGKPVMPAGLTLRLLPVRSAHVESALLIVV